MRELVPASSGSVVCTLPVSICRFQCWLESLSLRLHGHKLFQLSTKNESRKKSASTSKGKGRTIRRNCPSSTERSLATLATLVAKVHQEKLRKNHPQDRQRVGHRALSILAICHPASQAPSRGPTTSASTSETGHDIPVLRYSGISSPKTTRSETPASSLYLS